MATTEIVNIYKQLAKKPTVTRGINYVMQRIEAELEKRARKASQVIGS